MIRKFFKVLDSTQGSEQMKQRVVVGVPIHAGRMDCVCHRQTRREEISTIPRIPVCRKENGSSERSSNLPKVTQ